MNDPHRLDLSGRPPAPVSGPRGGGTALRALLWIVLIVSASINIVLNTFGSATATVPGTAAGIVAVACIAGLVTHHFRRRRS
ncbi:hypothetical protein [Streptosporangium roseum]|uniref:Uncharacterized protein n=1 Tax=Streptosporangium roseum (strain ATCC 12428 / DSM 43021 / JCM 3005 / KCTC 9067 / NCIMB 10171 / NRRL 2505 / NI 9100) TaxID=479432 RepID=D2AZB8_STRRD|nr:hypothetical protein [Streptosporangium roseum]ACZ83303.1 hypothetical protein Sros_0271 [Streptosporangium roseum DSM 43021]